MSLPEQHKQRELRGFILEEFGVWQGGVIRLLQVVAMPVPSKNMPIYCIPKKDEFWQMKPLPNLSNRMLVIISRIMIKLLGKLFGVGDDEPGHGR